MRTYKASIPATPFYPCLVKKKVPPELRFQGGQSQPTLDAIRKLAVALSVSADMLLFAQDERGPDDDLKLQFEAASRLDPEEKNVIRSVIESIVLRNTFKAAERRFTNADSGVTPR